MDRDEIDVIGEELRQQMGMLREVAHSEIAALLEGQAALGSDLLTRVRALRSELIRQFEQTRAEIPLSDRAIEDEVRTLESGLSDAIARLARAASRPQR